MKLYCNKQLPANAQVNRVGKYLYKHLDGAFKFKTSSNMCDVYLTLLYSIPTETIKKYSLSEEYQDVHEVTIDLNITTYQNKLRVNVIELTPQERTLGFDVYDTKLCDDLEILKDRIFKKTVSRIVKAYKDYEFLF